MNNILQIVFVVVILVFIYLFYREDNNHYLRNLIYSHNHKENFRNQRLQPIKNLTKLEEEDLKTCVNKVRTKTAENVNRMDVNSNLHMFNLDDIKNSKDAKNLNRTQKIATLNCSYWDLDNDAINKYSVPQSGELFIA
jgi:hypothetical protein